MELSGEKKEPLQIDVGAVLRSKNPSLAKAVPSFLIRYLKKIIHQDGINELLESLERK